MDALDRRRLLVGSVATAVAASIPAAAALAAPAARTGLIQVAITLNANALAAEIESALLRCLEESSQVTYDETTMKRIAAEVIGTHSQVMQFTTVEVITPKGA